MNINFNTTIWISGVRYWSFGHMYNTGYRSWSQQSVKSAYDQILSHVKRNKDGNR